MRMMILQKFKAGLRFVGILLLRFFLGIVAGYLWLFAVAYLFHIIMDVRIPIHSDHFDHFYDSGPPREGRYGESRRGLRFCFANWIHRIPSMVSCRTPLGVFAREIGFAEIAKNKKETCLKSFCLICFFSLPLFVRKCILLKAVFGQEYLLSRLRQSLPNQKVCGMRMCLDLQITKTLFEKAISATELEV